jgi:hemoglobin-like flavoprotein
MLEFSARPTSAWGAKSGILRGEAPHLTIRQGCARKLGCLQSQVSTAMSLSMIVPAAKPAKSASADLSADQKRLIRETFATIEPAADLVARLFYLKSVDLDPSVGTIFKMPTRAQRRKFMAAMKLAVISLDRLQALAPIIKLLSARQRLDGVKPRHYAAFRKAWVWTLEQSLEFRFTAEARAAWAALLGQMHRTTKP